MALGIDCWDGSASQVRDFKNFTGITYPLLLNGSNLQNEFDLSYDYSVVLGKDGQVKYRGNGVQTSKITAAIESALAE
jgi:hypothetical protein